jgi:hypothetical protein
VLVIVACGSSTAPKRAPSNHASPHDCAITGVVFDTFAKAPAVNASVVLTGPGLPREVQRTDEAGRFTFAHAGGRTRLGIYYSDRPEEHATATCGEIRIEIKAPTNLIDI